MSKSIDDRTINMLELKNEIDRLMDKHMASFYTQVDKDGHVRVVIAPRGPYIAPENIVTMFNTKTKE